MSKRETTADFDELNVKRLNVRDEKGNLRLTLSNSDRMPDPVVEGKVLEGMRQVDDDTAGLIFFNTEGDECGGLVFRGSMTPDGASASGFLSFDEFRQNESVTVSFSQKGEASSAGFSVYERPNKSVLELVDKREEIERRSEEIRKMEPGPDQTNAALELQKEIGFRRLFVGRNVTGEIAVRMADSKGRERIRLRIDESDVPRLEFLGEDGSVTYSLPPE